MNKINIRLLQEQELSEADKIFRLAFGTLDISKIENKVKLSKPFIYKVSQMNPTLEYIYNHPKETKRIRDRTT